MYYDLFKIKSVFIHICRIRLEWTLWFAPISSSGWINEIRVRHEDSSRRSGFRQCYSGTGNQVKLPFVWNKNRHRVKPYMQPNKVMSKLVMFSNNKTTPFLSMYPINLFFINQTYNLDGDIRMLTNAVQTYALIHIFICESMFV